MNKIGFDNDLYVKLSGDDFTRFRPLLPRYAYPGPEVFYSVLYDYIVNELGKNYAPAGVGIPAPLILEVDESDKEDIKVYGNFCYDTYDLEGTTLMTKAGGSYPGCIHMKSTDDGYEVTGAEWTTDGAGYVESAKKIFGSRFEAFEKLNSDEKNRNEIRAQVIANYAAANDLDITAYQDYGWDPVKLPKENIDSFYSELN